MKPKLSIHPERWHGWRCWQCSDGEHCGIGETPHDAYMDWVGGKILELYRPKVTVDAYSER